ncbi:MAG TPA: hypothetical protein VGR84_18975 [Candidatus Acidoferrales bacterium]|nr:hypothetical protein [Candidatus Acidoferrales bacterium]
MTVLSAMGKFAEQFARRLGVCLRGLFFGGESAEVYVLSIAHDEGGPSIFHTSYALYAGCIVFRLSRVGSVLRSVSNAEVCPRIVGSVVVFVVHESGWLLSGHIEPSESMLFVVFVIEPDQAIPERIDAASAISSPYSTFVSVNPPSKNTSLGVIGQDRFQVLLRQPWSVGNISRNHHALRRQDWLGVRERGKRSRDSDPIIGLRASQSWGMA